jgi:hypothetical protein
MGGSHRGRRFMMATTCRALRPTPAEVAYAFMTDALALSAEQRAQLRRLGISEAAIDRDPGRESAPIRAAHVVFSARYFDFAREDDSEAVFVACARDLAGNASDIIAFDLAGRLASWLRREQLLGAHHVLAPRFDEPLRVFPNVWAWLRSDRDGVVILDWRRAPALLDGVTIAVDSVEFGQVLRQRLTRAAPPIVVRNLAEAAA